MFEKEAEEYKDNTRIKDKNTYVGFPNERISELQDFEGNYIDISERIIKAFKDGAEFGYNKANEWHFVKDGDFPKTKGNYLVAWERTHHIEEFGEWGFDVDLFNIEEEYFEGTGDYAIAWKEIVSPIVSPKEASE